MANTPAPHDETERLREIRDGLAKQLDDNALPGPSGVCADLARLIDHFDRRIGDAPVRALQAQNQQLIREVAPARQLGPLVDELLLAVQEAGLTTDFFTGRWAGLLGPLNRLEALRERPI